MHEIYNLKSSFVVHNFIHDCVYCKKIIFHFLDPCNTAATCPTENNMVTCTFDGTKATCDYSAGCNTGFFAKDSTDLSKGCEGLFHQLRQA